MAFGQFALWTALAVGIAFPASAQRATSGSRSAYEIALRCFVVAGKTDRAGARASYDAVMRLGGVLGLSNRQINSDFASAISTENIKFMRDGAYRQRIVSQCRQLGLAS